jgi:7-cyano-7-deazaguanine synthase
MKSVVLLSGGMDSTVLLHQVKASNRDPVAISFDYGQRHIKEIKVATQMAASLGVPHTVVALRSTTLALFAGSSQTDKDVDVPHGHYEDPTMRLTYVPNRNMIMVSLAAALAVSLKGDTIWYAAHAGDHAIYPDCRQAFVDAMNSVLQVANYTPIRLEAPFLNKTKADILKLGHQLGVRFEKTYSCYEGADMQCGLCGTCQERRWAFQEAGLFDPTEYANTAVGA